MIKHKYLIPLFAIGIVISATCASADITANMNIQPRVLRVGEPAELTFTIRGIDNPPRPPIQPINGLQINGPRTGTSINQSVVNGRVTMDRSTMFTYRVISLQPGDYTIGPYTYVINGKATRFEPITIKVVSSQTTQGAGDNVQGGNPSKPLLARITTDRNDTLFNQEIFDLYVEIYHRGDVNIGRDIGLNNMPTTGLSLGAFEELNQSREVIDGEIYQVRRFRAKAHALTAGEFTLHPTLRVPLLVPRKRRGKSFFDDPFANFFGAQSSQPYDITPEPLVLDIKPLPTTSKPTDFSGAVGQFTFAVDAKPAELEAGEPITISMIINGAGNIENVDAPSFPENDHFKVYEARRVENDINQQSAIGRKVFEQVIIPKTDTIKELPALSFNYFNPASEKYETITKGPFPITVHPSSQNSAQLLQAAAPGSDEEAEVLGSDLIYLKPAPKQWVKNSAPQLKTSRTNLLLQLLPPIAVAGFFLLHRRRKDLQTNHAKARRLRAPKRAQAGLKKAQQALDTQQTNQCYDGLWEALSSYFGDRMNLAPGEVTPSRVIDTYTDKGLDPDMLKTLKTIFEHCEQHRFGAGNQLDPEVLQNFIKTVPAILKAAERIRL